jgi:hypothetical protein
VASIAKLCQRGTTVTMKLDLLRRDPAYDWRPARGLSSK